MKPNVSNKENPSKYYKENIREKQYNCMDCDYQGVKQEKLRKHIIIEK